MISRIWVFILGLAVMFASTGFAGDGDPAGVPPGEDPLAATAGIEDLIAAARDRNPSIASARAAWKASIENVRIVSALPDPQLTLTWFPAPIETRLGPQEWTAMVSQQIPFPGKLSAKEEIAAIGAVMARLRTDQTFREIVAEVKTAFYELAYIRKAREIAGKNLEILNRFQGMAESAYAQDRTLFVDVVKAQSQAGQVRYDLLLLEDLEETQITALNGLLNREPRAPIGRLSGGTAFPALPSLDWLFQTAEERQEAIASAGQAVRKAERENDLARYSYYPDFRIGATWSGIGEPNVTTPPPDAGDDAFGIQFGISIPLWSGKNRGRVLQSQSVVREKRTLRDKIVNETRTNIRTLYYKARNSFRQTELYERDLLPQALRSLEVSETWFREGEGPFSDVLESQSAVYNFQLSLARAQSDIGKNMAQLERLIGAPISGPDNKGGAQ